MVVVVVFSVTPMRLCCGSNVKSSTDDLFASSSQESTALPSMQAPLQGTDEPLPFQAKLIMQEDDSTLIDIFGEKAKIYLTQHLVSIPAQNPLLVDS